MKFQKQITLPGIRVIVTIQSLLRPIQISVKAQYSQGIREDVNSLDKYNDKETPLNIQQYRAQMEQV